MASDCESLLLKKCTDRIVGVVLLVRKLGV